MYCPKCKSKIVDIIRTDNLYVKQFDRDTEELYDNINTECFCRECNTTFYLYYDYEEN